jgi:hypothetical protein
MGSTQGTTKYKEAYKFIIPVRMFHILKGFLSVPRRNWVQLR